MQKDRLNWINTSKAVCMMIVYFYHCECYLGFNKSDIYHFYSPFFTNAFFFITGYLLFRKELTKGILATGTTTVLRDECHRYIANVIFRITIPTLLFAICLFFPKMAIGMKTDFVNDVLLGGSSWFTTALSVAEIAMLLLLATRQRRVWYYILGAVIFMSIAVGLHTLGMPNLYYFQSGLSATILIVLGGAYYNYERQLDRILKWYVILPIALIYVLLIIMYKDYAHWSVYGIDFSIIGFVCTIISIWVVVSLAKITTRTNQLIQFLGNNTLPFYLLCGAIPKAVCMCISKINYGPFYTVSISFIFSLLLAYLAVKLITKYIPYLLDFRLLLHKH